jgi:hypothetical protein
MEGATVGGWVGDKVGAVVVAGAVRVNVLEIETGVDLAVVQAPLIEIVEVPEEGIVIVAEDPATRVLLQPPPLTVAPPVTSITY